MYIPDTRYDTYGYEYRVRVLHVEPFFLPADIQHTQCPCRFFNPRETSSVVTKPRHRDTAL